MQKYLKLFLLCILFCGFLSMPVISQAAPSEETQTIGWNYENGSYTFYYLNGNTIQPFTKTGIIHFGTTTTLQDSEEHTTTFSKGLYYFSNGKLNLSTGPISSLPVFHYRTDNRLEQVEKAWYRIDRKAVEIEDTDTETILTPKSVYFTGCIDSKVFLNGTLYTGIAAKDNVFYQVKDGVLGSKFTGIVNKKYVDTTLKRLCNANNKCYKNGVAFTGVYNKRYYKKGIGDTYTGWMKLDKNIYYFQNGVALTGNHYLKSYGGGNNTYYYSFRSNGTLNMNLFSDSKIDYRKKKLKVNVNITTHTVTILAYNNTTKTYDTPLKAFICSTSRTYDGTKTGNFRMHKGGRLRWFSPEIAKGKRHYQWATHIYGSGALFHSEVYRSLNPKSFDASSYNGLGTNQSTTCIRLQAVNAKLLYDLASLHSSSNAISVQIFRSSNKGAFGQVKLSDTTGKIPTSMKYDPTDPSIKKK